MGKEAMAQLRILVIDDDEVMRELLAALLGVQGYQVLTAGSGEEGLLRLREPQPPLLLLTDLQMPGLEGAALTSALRAAAPPAAVLIGMSGRKPDEAVLRPLDGFLAKPFDSRSLQQTFAAAAEAKAARSPGSFLAGNGDSGIASKTTPKTTPKIVPGAPVIPVPSMATIATDEGPSLDEAIFAALARNFQPAQMGELYQLTLRDVRERHRRMEAHAAQGALEEVQREAHAIKGACGMVGARELQHLAASLEGGSSVDTAALAAIPAACERLNGTVRTKLQQKW